MSHRRDRGAAQGRERSLPEEDPAGTASTVPSGSSPPGERGNAPGGARARLERDGGGDARDERFLPEHRLRRSRDFRVVYREGNRARGTWMSVVARDNDLGTTRLGLSVGRACWRSAVRRNRVRRVFREAFRLEREALPSSVDLVLVAAKGAWPDLASTRRELVRLSHKAWRRYREKIDARAAPSEGGAGDDGTRRASDGGRT